jgi:hypothetical protein
MSTWKIFKSICPKTFKAKGDIYVFVDECHRTQSGKLHKAMKAILPDAMFIGFTGTPLLKKDKATSLETYSAPIFTPTSLMKPWTDNVVLGSAVRSTGYRSADYRPGQYRRVV